MDVGRLVYLYKHIKYLYSQVRNNKKYVKKAKEATFQASSIKQRREDRSFFIGLYYILFFAHRKKPFKGNIYTAQIYTYDDGTSIFIVRLFFFAFQSPTVLYLCKKSINVLYSLKLCLKWNHLCYVFFCVCGSKKNNLNKIKRLYINQFK